MNQKSINRPQFEDRVVNAVESAIRRGVDPEIAYRTGKRLLNNAELYIRPRPYGVKDMGPLVSPIVKLDNRIRELGHANLVEPKGPSARAEISW